MYRSEHCVSVIYCKCMAAPGTTSGHTVELGSHSSKDSDLGSHSSKDPKLGSHFW